jgi:hypothetical protein
MAVGSSTAVPFRARQTQSGPRGDLAVPDPAGSISLGARGAGGTRAREIAIRTMSPVTDQRHLIQERRSDWEPTRRCHRVGASYPGPSALAVSQLDQRLTGGGGPWSHRNSGAHRWE